MYHPLSLNGYSKIINAVKRQRNLGLSDDIFISMRLVLLIPTMYHTGVCNSVKANSQKSFVGHPTINVITNFSQVDFLIQWFFRSYRDCITAWVTCIKPVDYLSITWLMISLYNTKRIAYQWSRSYLSYTQQLWYPYMVSLKGYCLPAA